MNSWPRLPLLALALLVPAATRAQVPPEKALSTFTVADGLELSLWASEPLFVNPTCIDVDHKGRVWVCESVNYRNKFHGKKKLNRPEGDCIVILEDTKGTGRADKATTFYQSPELLAPLGIAVAKDPVGPGYKVFVCQSPDILVFEDKDGDGKADGPPKKLLTGFGGYDHDHGVHGILIGPDLKLYFSVGDQGVHGLQSSDGKGRKWTSNSTDCRAGTIWRCDLDGTNLELIAHNFRNEYEPCVDSFGTVFVSDNDDDGNQQTRICYVMPGGNYGYHPRGPGESHWHEEQPGVVPKILRTWFGSPTGMCVYEGTLLPKKYQGQLLHTDAGPRHVRCYHLKPDGAGYAVEREDIVTSTDNWFRPSDVCVAPDGSVMVADWYDPGVGGHGMGDTTRGRIYRLAPRGHKYAVPKVDLETKEGILAALGSPNRAVRYMAMAKLRLLKFGDPASDKIIKALYEAATESKNPVLRARACWQLAVQVRDREPKDGMRLGMAVMGLGDRAKDPRVRILGLRIDKDLDAVGRMPHMMAQEYRFADMLKNARIEKEPAAVRREALLALRDVDPAKAKPIILQLAGQYDGKDRFYLEAVGIAVGHHDKARRDVILADFDKHFPEWNDKVADLVWELRPPSMLPKLEKLLADTKLPARQRARVIDILAASDDRAAGKALLKVLQADVPAEVREKVLDNLKRFLPGKWRDLRNSPELGETIRGLLAKADTRATGLSLVGAAERTADVPRVAELARDTKEGEPVRKAAVATLGQLPTPAAVTALAGLLEDRAVGDDAATALGRLAQRRGGRAVAPQALKVLQDAVTAKGPPGPARRAALSALAGTRPGSQWLLDQHARKALSADLAADAGRLLRNSPYVDLRNKAMIAFPPPGRLDPRKLPSPAALAARKGDPARGKQLLAASVNNDMQCLKCHTIRGTGGQVGPDLSVIGKKASKENLFESILFPSKAIADQYLTWQVETTKGLSLAGLLVEETPTSITLRDGNGKDTRIDKKEIESRTKSPKSLMPEDLVKAMTEDQLVDMVAYLFSLKTPALALDHWHIAGPFDNGAGDAGIDRVFPPEKGIDRKAVYPGKSGPVRWRSVKPNAQGYVDLQAFFAPDSANIVSYLYRDIESPADQDATVLLGVDDCAKLWVNGRLAHTSREHVTATPERYAVPVKLHKGVNRLLLKITNGDGPHGFYLTVLAEQELKRMEEK
jgi:putative membrane-bound dehydrogenase-like protein